MDFIKKNLGFLIISLVCLGIAGFLGYKCLGAKERMKENQAKSKTDKEFLDGLGKKRKLLTQENIDKAEANKTKCQDGLKKVKEEIKANFKLEYTTPDTPADALRDIRQEVAAMRAYVEENNVYISDSLAELTFEVFSLSNKLPSSEDLPQLFRQLTMIKHVLEVVVANKIESIERLARPLGLGVREEGEYIVTPLEITVTGKPADVQNFVNSMSRTVLNQKRPGAKEEGKFVQQYFFVLRNVEIKAEDMLSKKGEEFFKESKAGESRGGRDMAMGGMEEGGRPGKRRERKKASTEEPSGDMKTEAKESDWVERPASRQDGLVFEPKQTTWTLCYDWIEPKFAEENPEETSEAK